MNIIDCIFINLLLFSIVMSSFLSHPQSSLVSTSFSLVSPRAAVTLPKSSWRHQKTPTRPASSNQSSRQQANKTRANTRAIPQLLLLRQRGEAPSVSLKKEQSNSDSLYKKSSTPSYVVCAWIVLYRPSSARAVT